METTDDHNGNVLVAPSSFSMVEDGIYRSSLPKSENFGFLTTLNLRSVVYLCPDPYPEENLKFYEANNIKLFQFGVKSLKDHPAPLPKDTFLDALKLLLDVRNHPILIHCKAGKHRTGCLVGCLRKVQSWCLSSVLEEYHKYAGWNVRQRDLTCIETFDTVSLRQCFLSIMYRYHGYGPKRKRLLYEEENVQKPKQQASTEV